MRELFFAVAVCSGVYAQTFEVASIKVLPPPDGGPMFQRTMGGPGSKDPGRWTAENVSLADLVRNAYDLRPYQLNAPDWLNSARFTVTATVPQGAKKEDLKVMVRHLMEERFGLKVHHETKDYQTFDLVVAKGGPKFKEAVEVPEADAASPSVGGLAPQMKVDPEGYPVLPAGKGSMTMMTGAKARMRQSKITMERFANTLSYQVSKPVTDATGLQGEYDFTIAWSPGSARASDESELGPTIFAALQEQLGLKLEPKKGVIDVVVVDHVEKTPTEN